jgi:hypothetical protein
LLYPAELWVHNFPTLRLLVSSYFGFYAIQKTCRASPLKKVTLTKEGVCCRL